MAYKVAIPQDITQAGKDFLIGKGYEVVVGSGETDTGALRAQIADADALLARLAKYPAEVLSAGTRLKVIGRHGVGVDNIDLEYCRKNNIAVTYTPNANALSVAEHTIASMLAAALHFSRFDRAVRSGNWTVRTRYNGMDLEGKTLGLVGLGRIGFQVAVKAMAAFNMKVVGYDPFLPEEKFPQGVSKASAPEEVFRQGDFVSLHTPCTPETKNMVNAAMLSLMKPGAYLINCARGELVVEEDLYQALKSGVIGGAALDVLQSEPPSPDNPLLSLDNILFTPHTGSMTQESLDRMGLHAAMGIHDILSGGTPEWPIK